MDKLLQWFHRFLAKPSPDLWLAAAASLIAWLIVLFLKTAFG